MKKIVVNVPISHADEVRKAIGEAGGGRIGKYAFCSFSMRGTGRCLPDADANPHIGTPGELEEIEEERIEVTTAPETLEDVITAIKRVHPYEEIAMDVWEVEVR